MCKLDATTPSNQFTFLKRRVFRVRADRDSSASADTRAKLASAPDSRPSSSPTNGSKTASNATRPASARLCAASAACAARPPTSAIFRITTHFFLNLLHDFQNLLHDFQNLQHDFLHLLHNFLHLLHNFEWPKHRLERDAARLGTLVRCFRCVRCPPPIGAVSLTAENKGVSCKTQMWIIHRNLQ